MIASLMARRTLVVDRPPVAFPQGVKFVTTAISYLSGDPHLGHAYELVCADFLKRSYEMLGYVCQLQTGTDEHGAKVANVASQHYQTPLEYCNQQVKRFEHLVKCLNVDDSVVFVRTTNERHQKFCQEMWKRVYERDIYLGQYEGWYSIREERYLTDNEAASLNYKDGDTPLIKTSEPSYFFRLSSYQEMLLQFLEDHPDFIYPLSLRNQILKRLEEPLQDLSISRKNLNWGIPIPLESESDSQGDSRGVMYVWFDALFNYISEVNEERWKQMETTHIIGKDIVWFHAVIWPALLMAVDLPFPKRIVCHGFVNDDQGRKMSKSWNNGVDPFAVMDKFGSDAFRYFLLREGSFGYDFNYSECNLIQRHDTELVGKLGNLIHRVLSLVRKYYPLRTKLYSQRNPLFDVNELLKNYESLLDKCDYQSIVAMLFEKVDLVNGWLYQEAPWKKEISDEKRLEIISTAVDALFIFAHLFKPLLPEGMHQLLSHLISTNDSESTDFGWNVLHYFPTEELNILYKRIGETRHQRS